MSDSDLKYRSSASPSTANTPLRVFSLLTAVMTFMLVWVGGLVTSHGAGMAVPDWPNTYGYNMFFFPPAKWIGGILYEHSHRLIASGVGLLTSVLALWLYGHKSRKLLTVLGLVFFVAGVFFSIVRPARLAEDVLLAAIGLVALISSGAFCKSLVIGLRPLIARSKVVARLAQRMSTVAWPTCEPSPKWMRTLGLIAFFAVVIQGVLGGLRVTEMKDELGIFHATLAQMFFCLVSALALFQTNFWKKLQPGNVASSVKVLYAVTTLLILSQLVLGATMRHQHAGLAIPDFPLAYGKWWPATDSDSVAHYNQTSLVSEAYGFITPTQIVLQMVHRIVALAIVVCVVTCFVRTLRTFGWQNLLTRWSCAWVVLICCQAFLGAATIWTGKSADIATAHVAFGALSLLSGTLLTIVAFRMLAANANRKLRAVPIENSFGISHSHNLT
ncbi:MAG: COX15/CtaA family protein [Limisphaerales bacterium]